MEAVDALREIAFQLERAAEPTYRVRAFRRAAQVVSDLAAGELEQRVRDGTLEALPGIGKVTAEVITQATAGEQPAYLARVLAEAPASQPTALRAALRLPYPLGLTRWRQFTQGDGGGCQGSRARVGRAHRPLPRLIIRYAKWGQRDLRGGTG